MLAKRLLVFFKTFAFHFQSELFNTVFFRTFSVPDALLVIGLSYDDASLLSPSEVLVPVIVWRMGPDTPLKNKQYEAVPLFDSGCAVKSFT